VELHNINIEKSILNYILFNQDLIDDIISELDPKYFYLSDHQKVFKSMAKLNNEEIPVDEEFIKKDLSADENFREDTLIEILSSTSSANINHYIKEIKDLYFRREVISLSHNIKQMASDSEHTMESIEDKMQSDLFSIVSNKSEKDFKDANDISSATIDYLAMLKKKGNKFLTGTDTGFFGLNKMTTGFQEGDLVIIGARPSMGKTAFALSMMLKNLENGIGVAMFSLEMPAEHLMMRLLSMKTSINLQDLRVGNLDDDQLSKVSYALNEFKSRDLFVYDEGNLNINDLKSKAKKIKIKHPNIGMIIIDYLQLMGGSSGKDRHLEVSEISRGLKLLARSLKVPIVALSQLNRNVDARPNRRPIMSDIRESGSIEQDADIIIFIYRDDVYKEIDERKKEKDAKDKGKEYENKYKYKSEEEAEILIAKQRNGPIGMTKLTFIKKSANFIDPGESVEVIYDENIQKTNTDVQIDPENIDDPMSGMF
jgi:replicative DNA helicase